MTHDPTATVSDAGRALDGLLSEYFSAWFQFHPEAAVDAGVDGYAGRLRPHHDDDIGALIALNENLIGALEELPLGGLDEDRRIDYRLVYGAALLELHELVERDWRYRDPAAFLPVNAIHQLTLRPVARFGEALQARLEAVPGHLRSARSLLATAPELIPQPWLTAAVEEARAGAALFRALPGHPRLVRAFSSLGRTVTLLEAAAHALEDFAGFLEGALAQRAHGAFACGRAQFERILRHHHFLDVDCEGLHAFGAQLAARTEAELRQACRRLRGDEDVAALNAALRADHPSADALLDSYRTRMQAAHAFVAERELVTLPGRQRLQVLETPAFLRHSIPFAAYLPPSPSDPDQCGYYYVTPAADEELLGEHNHTGIGHTCVHEAWPGHHLQFVTAHGRATSRTLARLLNPSATLYEGWALYSEQLMVEQGFLDRPEHEFMLLRDRLWRALRVQLDVELHTRELGLEQAAERLHTAVGLPKRQAMTDLFWYSRAPGVPLGYAAGWALITAARESLEVSGEPGALRSFHDRLLSAGSVALPLALGRAFGEELAGRAQEQVFGPRPR